MKNCGKMSNVIYEQRTDRNFLIFIFMRLASNVVNVGRDVCSATWRNEADF